MRSLILLIVTATLLAAGACGDGSGDVFSQADCLRTPVAIPTGDVPTAPPGARPQGRCGTTVEYTVPYPTATPDLSGALPPQQALQQLLDTPGVASPIEAALNGDVASLLTLIDWQDKPCGGREGSDRCPEGVAAGAELPSANMGGAITFWAREETARAALEDLLAGPLDLTFAARDDGDTYYVGLQGAPRPTRASLLWGGPGVATGVFLVVQSGSDAPVIQLRPLFEGAAAAYAASFGYTAYEIIAYVP